MKESIPYWQQVKDRVPGVALAATLAFAAQFISAHYGGPAMLYALLFGMVLYFLSEAPRYAPGIQWASRRVLHLGVALLGARMGVDVFLSLGWQPVVMVVVGVSTTILFGMWLAQRLGMPLYFGMLSGGATAICGASAALAISSVLPKEKDSESLTLFTIFGVTALSTLCMILYPLLVTFLNLDDSTAGILLGATIHDVAQVVGAGFMISDVAGDQATIVKLMRVAMLVPVCVIMAMGIRQWSGADSGEQKASVPWFLWAFIALSVIASFHLISPEGVAVLSDVSRACLMTAIAAIGLKTSLGRLRHIGLKPLILIVSETVFLLLIVLAMLWTTGYI